MALQLTIENETSLPDGGPLSVTVTGERGIDIGRDQHLDWTLPDPSRYISGKHCEIRYRDGGYWLHDVSTNGTFLNDSDGRLKGPYRLRHGDRLTIGQYIILVAIDGEDRPAQANETAPAPPRYHELWMDTGDEAPPVDPRDFRAAPDERPARAGFLDWAADVPDPFGSASSPPPDQAASPIKIDDDMSWARGSPPVPLPAPPAPPIPAPRRPVWVSSTPGEPWTAPPSPNDTPHEASPPAAPVPPPALGQRAISASAAVDPSVAAEFLRGFARGAGIPEGAVASEDAGAFAEQLGAIVRLVVEDLQQLLNARLQAKRLTRSRSQTTVQALDNNPLKFSPTADEALRIMFGPPTRSYLDARRALEQSFADLKAHQVKTYSAMQSALRQLFADLEPSAIEHEAEGNRGIGAVISSRKAKMWDIFATRWKAKSLDQQGGLVEAYMRYFSDCYDRSDNKTE
jgi:type VI secretion system protein ImpI